MSPHMLFELAVATWETLYMTIVSSMIASLIGIPLGVILFSSNHHALFKNNFLHKLLGTIVNMVRSIPFIIFMIAVIPLTFLIVGSRIGTLAAIVPLSLSAIPFVARLVESALAEVDKGLLEAGTAMGATPLQIITKILLPEALPGIINAITLTLITLIGYTAMAGTIGGGGLGTLAINYGYQRFDTLIMIETVVLLIVIVQLIQSIGNFFANRLLARR